MENEKLLDKFLKGLKKGVSGTEMDTLKPWGPLQLEPYFFDLWAKELIEAIDKIKERKIPMSKVAKSFPSNAVIRDVFGYFVVGMKILKTNKAEMVDRSIFLLRVLEERSKSSDFSFLKENIIHDKSKINKIIESKKWQKPTKYQQAQIGILTASLRNLMWGLYTDIFVNTGFEISGPYNLERHRQLVIRDFFDLKPVLIWPEVKNFLYSNIKIYSIYQNNQIEIKMFNRIFSKKGLTNSLERFAIEGCKEKDLEKINSNIISFTEKQQNTFNRLDFEIQKKLYLKIKHYALKEFFKLADMNWESIDDFYQRVKGKKLIPPGDFKLKPSQVAEIYVKVFDPRNDFLPQL